MLVGALGEGVEHELDAMLAAYPEHAWIGPAVTGLLGLEAGTASLEESFLAVRRLFELLADERPLAIAIEDAHWADNVLLDLVEHLADLVRDAPIFVLLLARPELYDVRPNWPGGRPNATTILLDRLPPRRPTGSRRGCSTACRCRTRRAGGRRPSRRGTRSFSSSCSPSRARSLPRRATPTSRDDPGAARRPPRPPRPGRARRWSSAPRCSERSSTWPH
jgi:hypothetical protein